MHKKIDCEVTWIWKRDIPSVPRKKASLPGKRSSLPRLNDYIQGREEHIPGTAKDIQGRERGILGTERDIPGREVLLTLQLSYYFAVCINYE
ncbi:hypothetical protein [Gracilibacillus lacisalsi]|uniref:hypothetical protein n=1 Tax=Gracilibacillus lacisalsi TaxID=393087 RepID=UPI0012EA955E|nr:hypothetical protein [Gracilibacillus lacisalsi]